MLKQMQTYSDHSDVSVNLHRLILHQVGQPIQQTDKKKYILFKLADFINSLWNKIQRTHTTLIWSLTHYSF